MLIIFLITFFIMYGILLTVEDVESPHWIALPTALVMSVLGINHED